jgi:hypothetical protein
MDRWRQPFASLGFVSVGAYLLLTGCPGTLDDPARFEPEAGVERVSAADAAECQDVPTLLSSACGSGGCHSSADKSQGLDLQSPNLTSRLVCVSAVGGGLLVDPSTPSRSVLYAKLSSSPPFGARMPTGAAPFDDATRACILSWISALKADTGSCNDGGDPDAQSTNTSDAGSDGGV